MNEQRLRDQAIHPDDEVLAKILGASYGTYQQFIRTAADMGIFLEWRYYHDGKAWLGKGLYKWQSVRGANKEKTVFWLSVWDGFFKVSLFFPEKSRSGLNSLKVSETVRTIIDDAKPMGKLKFFPLVFEISADYQYEDIFPLMEYAIFK